MRSILLILVFLTVSCVVNQIQLIIPLTIQTIILITIQTMITIVMKKEQHFI